MKSENHLLKPLPFGGICPDCNNDVLFYATAKDKKGGRYKCTKCSRDTIWKYLKPRTVDDVLTSINAKIKAKKSSN